MSERPTAGAKVKTLTVTDDEYEIISSAMNRMIGSLIVDAMHDPKTRKDMETIADLAVCLDTQIGEQEATDDHA